jgi:arylsulfatase A
MISPPVLLRTAALALLTLSLPHATHAEKLNVIFILADDLGWGELGCYGQQKIPTPNIDRLASQGMRWTHHYSGAPVCAPVSLRPPHRANTSVTPKSAAIAPWKKCFPPIHRRPTPPVRFGHHRGRGLQKGRLCHRLPWENGDSAPSAVPAIPTAQGFDLFLGYNCQGRRPQFLPTPPLA